MTTTKEKVIVSAQVDASLRDELLRRAEEDDRSLSAQIRRALQQHLERDNSKEEA